MMKRHGSIETNANTSNSNNTKSTHKSRDQSKDGPGNGPFPTGSGGPSSSSSSKIKKPLSLSSRPQNSNRSKTHKSGAPKDSHGSVDDHASARMYDSIPPLEVTTLPRGGISIETEAVGRIQFGIPPETIKDSMLLGINVPLYYIVPVERFCREMGPALGVNLAEFEFPAYFNFFVQKARCTLIVDSEDAERNIRRVFSETLLGPAQFRRKENPIRYDPEDFAPDFSPEAIPDFEKELKHFRVMPDGQELVLEKLLNFCHFEHPFETRTHENLGVPPPEPIDAKISSDKDNAAEKKSRSSAYSRMKLCAEVAVLYPNNASQKDIAKRTCKRVEIFKMQGGEEYVLHDINENNIIVGKSRFSGNVRVSESMSVHGFGDQGDSNIEDYMQEEKTEIPKSILPPTFHPPSFGVTVLGNSHGFDKSGSVSGYVLWINGRGVMIDPPPYSSATLEREGIRPRTIVGIILTHCHADHDAGAFQKVLTGSPVVVITTPTIYKSFIRKYAALSNLSPALLRHCHRHKPAIIGAPLRFQGATFQFTYTLHSIPCVGFRVEWRGRSMVFTGDHFNSPPDIDKLQDSGVLAAARADDLRNLPLQETDLLLHEAGVPPLHTPLDVLLKLPQEVKRRLYVVHTQALPPGCELRVAPTGTAGTIRLDENSNTMATRRHTTSLPPKVTDKLPYEDELAFQSMWSSSEYESFGEIVTSSAPQSRAAPRSSINSYSMVRGRIEPPPVALRPTSTTDSWFLLNLLSAVPFLSGLSYASTMEVLETARVDAFCINEVVVHASRRSEVLCVVWEGTCTERPATKLIAKSTSGKSQSAGKKKATASSTSTAVWHAGDWTGPISLQPEKHLSGESNLSSSHDVVAMSQQGVKVIIIEFASLHKILKSGSLLYRTYLRRKKDKEMTVYDHIPDCLEGATNKDCFINDVRNLEILELLKYNTTLRKLSAVQKRHLESLAEGPVYFKPGQRLWRSGTAVEKAYMIVGGTVSFVAKRRNAGSAGVGISSRDFNSADSPKNEFDDFSSIGSSIGEMMRQDAAKVRLELEEKNKGDHDDNKLGNPSADDDLSYQSSISSDSDVSLDMNKETGDFALCPAISMQDSVRSAGSSVYNLDYERLNISLQKRADNLGSGKSVNRRDSESSGDYHSQISIADNSTEDGEDVGGSESDTKATRRRSSRDRNANRQLNRLYNRRAFTAGLVFSKGHFLGDISKMVAGLLSSTYQGQNDDSNGDDNSAKYGFGEKNEGNPNSRGGHIGEMTIHEQEGDQHIVHSSTLAAGKDGCVVLVFPKPSLILFLDEYPGLLLSLLGTQVVL
eukprot:CAMPEP_0203662688 /NCGR_PEP_ID=MMETSP0090-20130426/567_1 /ASSEMBLY_ACC=CAM_ASM_001088 /TAXON_ID=426623 /ORGANISM="Chaetoceros affinis, Strain CCMP159" /LENGTH=1308 /DNA_ID=CAMNT_0050525513 /DNA_START=591 /DNA_END=4517 /DNA_ORIENTATION=+